MTRSSQCEHCSGSLKHRTTQAMYCSKKCAAAGHYARNKSYYQERNRLYYINNKDRVKECSDRWARNNVQRRRENARRYQTSLYGITQAIYLRMKKEQNSQCLICKLKKRPLVIDHCHSSNKVRGLLCRSCNQGLGLMKDNPRLLRDAIAYLERTPPQWLRRQ